MQLTAFTILAISALAAASPAKEVSPLTACTAEFRKCQTTASALTLLGSCAINLAACSASGAMSTLDDALDQTMTTSQKKAYRKCQKQYDECRVAPEANMSTCSSEAVACFSKVEEK